MADPDAQQAKRAIEETARKGVPLHEGEEPSLAGITREEFAAGTAGATKHNELVRRQSAKSRWVRLHMQRTGKGYWEAEKEWRRTARENRAKYDQKTTTQKNPYNKEMKTLKGTQEINTPSGVRDVAIEKQIPTGKNLSPLGDAAKAVRNIAEEFARKRGIETILRGGEVFVKKTANPALAMYGVNDVQGGTTARVDTPQGKANEFWSNGQLQQVIVDKGNGKYQIIKNPKKLKEYAASRQAEVELAEAQTLEAPIADVGAARAEPVVDNRAREDF